MALEKDLELLDDYLSNRMDGKEKEAFEEKLRTDSSLSEELKLQQSLVQGIKQARLAELKSMLNSIPVTTVPPSQTAMLTKIGSWALVSGILITATYFYFTRNEGNPVKPVLPEQQKVEPNQEQTSAPTNETTIVAQPEQKVENEIATKPVTKEKPAVTVTKPTIQAYDPTNEEAEATSQKYEKEQLSVISNAFVTSSMEVEMIPNDKKYNFHYVFNSDKLLLYGAFEKKLYEILEFIGEDKKPVVLYYKTNYYLLDVSKSTPTSLTPIKNKELLKKLQEHRQAFKELPEGPIMDPKAKIRGFRPKAGEAYGRLEGRPAR